MPPRLMIPGPVELEAAVLEVLAQPVLAHYGSAWVAIHDETIDLLKQAYKVQGRVYMMPGSGSLALDAAAHSTFMPGDTVIVGNNGWFGERLTDIMRANGVTIVPIHGDLRAPLTVETFADALQAHPNARGVALVHLETSTGILNPIHEIASYVHTHSDALVMVDAVTGLGGAPLHTEAWGIDICASASQKALGAPAGLGLVALSDRAWERIDVRSEQPRSWYLDLKRWEWWRVNMAAHHPFPVTMPTNIVVALRTALRSLLAEGLESRLERYQRQARLLRDGLAELDIELFVPEAQMAATLTTAYAPPGTDATAIRDYLLREHNLLITTGFADYSRTVLRVGHMGAALNEDDLRALLAGLKQYLSERQPA